MSSSDEELEELAAFWEARLDEAEATARYAGPGIVAWLSVHDDAGQFRYTTVAATSGDSDDVWCADGRELPEPASVRVIYDPARELRDVGADRDLLAALKQARERGDHVFGSARPDNIASGDWLSERMHAATQILDLEQVAKIRAAVHSDHPDYQERWKP